MISSTRPMQVTDAARFASRDCPYCGSGEKQALLQISCSDIFRSNWSYRPEWLQRLPVPRDQLFPFNECKSCGFIYAGLMPDKGFLETIYDCVIDADKARDSNLSASSIAWKMGNLSILLRLLADGGPQPRVLDFGCGFGPTLQLLNVIPTIRAIGYETSATRLSELQRGQLAATGKLQELESQGPYAAVILDNVLEHVENPRQTLAFIKSVCAPNAVLFISVPAIDRDSIAAAGSRSRLPMEINPWEHLNYFDVPHLDALLLEFMFRPVRKEILPAPVDIGLRPITAVGKRFRNGLASLPRLVEYLARGDVLPSVNGRFYRLEGKS